jgi:hypothetical protein
MMPLQSTRYLLQAVRWLRIAEAYYWVYRRNGDGITDHMRQVAGWAKSDFKMWRLVTFEA